MKKWLDFGLPMVFIICFIATIIFASTQKPRIFVVMSYSGNNLWEQEIRHGLEKTLADMDYNFHITYFYMSSKEFNSPAYLKKITEKAKTQIRNFRPDVILLVDDDPQQYIGKDFFDKPGYKIVFAGVADPEAFGYLPHKNVTGVSKVLPFSISKDTLQVLFPNYHSIINLSDGSTTSHYFNKQFSDYDWSPLQVRNTYMTNSFDEWKKIVELANQQNSLLLITLYHTVYSGPHRMSPEELLQWTVEHARVPLLGFFDIFTSDGGPIAVALSGSEQGELSAKILVRILVNKENPGDIPFTQNQHIKFAMNPKAMSVNIPNQKIPSLLDSLAYAGNSIYGTVEHVHQ